MQNRSSFLEVQINCEEEKLIVDEYLVEFTHTFLKLRIAFYHLSISLKLFIQNLPTVHKFGTVT